VKTTFSFVFLLTSQRPSQTQKTFFRFVRAMTHEMSPRGDSGIEDKKEKDYFSYPHSTDYLALVNNKILPMATADKWRHEFAAIIEFNNITIRVVLKECLFPGRCFDCKLNLKSACFCFWGQNTRDEILTTAFVGRVSAWREFLMAMGSDIKKHQDVFPDMDVMFPPKSLNRIPQHHMIPPVAPLLLQKPFSDVVPVDVFNNFIKIRQSFVKFDQTKKRQKKFTAGRASFNWSEPWENVKVRLQIKSLMEDTSGEFSDHEKRLALVECMEKLRTEWSVAVCDASCRKPSGLCKDCLHIRQVLKKNYKEGVRLSCTQFIKKSLFEKKAPFEKVPPIGGSFSNYEDDMCRVTRVMVTNE
jgi:hypothetical protein